MYWKFSNEKQTVKTRLFKRGQSGYNIHVNTKPHTACPCHEGWPREHS